LGFLLLQEAFLERKGSVPAEAESRPTLLREGTREKEVLDVLLNVGIAQYII
jgi:hypothetical protein